MLRNYQLSIINYQLKTQNLVCELEAASFLLLIDN